jgi:hypothetical protein
MSSSSGPKIITNSLVLHLDAADRKSYPGSGTVWRDRSGNGINGTLTNGATFSNSNGGTLVCGGGNSGYVSLGIPSLLNGIQVPLTICMWAKANSFGSYNCLWGVYSSTGGGRLYSLFRLDGAYVRYYTSNSSGGFQNNGSLISSTDTWNFYAVTVAGTLSSPIVTIYLNNSSQTFSYGALTATPDLTVNFRIGSNVGGGEFWNGNISNATWYNRALTSEEIKQNYNATKSRFGLL